MPADEQLAFFLRAAHFASHKHRDHRRKNGDVPYINHPLGVADILATEGRVRDAEILAAAVLHDTIEDTDTTYDELFAGFGERVAGVVAELTDDKSLPKHERKRQQVAHAGRLSTAARLVKLGDLLHNLRDLDTAPPPTWGVTRIQGYVCWAFHVVEAVGEANPHLQRALAELFAADLVFGGATHRKIPPTREARRDLLREYYESMSRVGD